MPFTEEEIKAVWEKARKVAGYEESMFRKDACGAWIMWDKYGKRDNMLGWVIDHIYPESLGGTNNLHNLRALQYQNNISKGDDYPSYTATVISDGEKNIHEERNLTVNKKIRERLKEMYNL